MKTCEDIKNANKIKTEQIKKYEEHGQKWINKEGEDAMKAEIENKENIRWERKPGGKKVIEKNQKEEWKYEIMREN